MTNLNAAKFGGAKRKNGHKNTCDCHICENMMAKAKRGGYQEEVDKKMEGGSKKKNGHKKDCACPICKNMANAKKGGSDEDVEPNENEMLMSSKNGSRPGGQSFEGGRKKRNKSRRGGEDPNVTKENIVKATDADYDSLEGGARRHKRKTRRNKSRRNKRRTQRRH